MATVLATFKSPTHQVSKAHQPSIQLLAGLGVAGDAHAGQTVKHRSRVAQDPSQPNLRQVHLIQAALFEELAGKGFHISPGQMGENITTSGVDLLSLPVNTRLHLGESAIVMLTGLRNPCAQLDGIRPGLMKAVLDRDGQGELVRKAGVMGIVLQSGVVKPGDLVAVVLPDGAFRRLEPV